MNKKILGVFLFAVFTMSSVWAQGRKGLRINEVLVTNETNYQDDYGCQSAWIEIFNTTFGTVDIRSCYLTNDRNNPKKYPIPKGDVLTEMPPRQHLLFWADDMPNRGTFHVNFKLDPDKDNWIGLYDANGKEVSAEKAATGGAAVYGDKNAQIKISDDGTDLVTNKYVTKDSVNDDLVFNLHVGADSEINNKISVTIEEMSSKGLGVEGLKVDTEDDATVSIDTISAAIQKVSSQRSALGAVQNRLEHTIDNLDNVVENTTAAESRIRDTDMAEEMVNYSKNDILAQANQSNQGVLSLLQ